MEGASTSRTNWSKCCLCQEEKGDETLISPLSLFQRKQDYAGYSNIAKNVPLFYAINDMPIPFNPSRLDEGEGIEVTLIQNKAKYHNSCRLLFNNTKLERAQKRRVTKSTSRTSDENRSKRPRTSDPPKVECFFCEKEDDIANLRSAMTMKLNERLNQCARTLNHGKLLAKLSPGDVVAQEMKYHPGCLADLYNAERAYLNSVKQEESNNNPQKDLYPVVFSELVIYIMDSKVSNTEATPMIFRLADLVSLYKQRLQQLGVDSPDVNSTRLKEQLLARIPELEAHKKGRDVLLAFKKDVGSVLYDACQYSEAIHLAKAADILRKQMLNHKTKFCSEFKDGFGEEAIPPALLQFVCSIEHGVDIRSHLTHGVVKSDLAIAQLLQYNCYTKYREGSATHRHSKDRETPFPLYVGLKVYAKTRKRELIDKLHENGISVSYDRVLEISGQLGETVIKQYVEEDVVCPPVLRKGLFTTSAVDNIDHNPTATTARSSFHGTSISMFQHPSSENRGEVRVSPRITDSRARKVPELPESYNNIPPAYFSKKNPAPSTTDEVLLPDDGFFQRNLRFEYDWLEKVQDTTNVDDSSNITWSAHHASQQRTTDFEISITSLLPLLRDQAHSVATIKHAMNKIREGVSFLNPGQVPVITADQPLYALAKQIQWHWPDEYGEDKFVIMFGGLHIEMTALKSIGSMLEDSGWTGALVEADVASSGTADSFLSATNVTRTRQAHQITACSLFQLMKKAYTSYFAEHSSEDVASSFEEWCDIRKKESLQFQLWFLILNMELTIFTLVRAFREGNFTLYCESLAELIPYFFANNNVNYARWLPIHLRDMMSLEKQHPEVCREFHKGNFVVHKSDRDFSSIAIDQAHEQNNAVIKGDGGAIGLTEDPSALRRWMVAGPEISQFVANYEKVSGSKDVKKDSHHHEQSPTVQKSFFEKVKRLTNVMEEMGNPFAEDTRDLLTLDTKDIADPSAAQLIATHLERGKEQFQAFMHRLKTDNKNFYQPIKRNNTDFFKTGPESSNKSETQLLKEDRQLFSRLFISCQTRGCDLREFFKHENQSFPPSLSKQGKLHTCTKSDLVDILQTKVELPESKPETDVLIVDGASLVNTIAPRTPKTFEDYARKDILPKVETYSCIHKRTDIVFDVYQQSSLKSEARSKRGKAVRRRVTSKSKTPSNWRSFLRDSANKTELFNFLADEVGKMTTTNLVIATRQENAVTSASFINTNLEELAPCLHEEADTRIFLHAWHAVKNGYKSIMIEANDTDIVVIALSRMPSLTALGLETMWVMFGKGEHKRWIPIHDLMSSLGPEKTKGILFFHAFTGCDVVSGFNGKGKRTAWQTWNVFNEASAVFAKLSQCPSEIEESDLQVLEKYVVLMYDRSSTTASVDEARVDLFARKQRSYELIPPTQSALKEHAKRAAFQAGHIWGQSTVRQPELPCPSEWGWLKDGNRWKIVWTSLEPVSKSCRELTKCGCKIECGGGRCKCSNIGNGCTPLCSCPCQIWEGTLI